MIRLVTMAKSHGTLVRLSCLILFFLPPFNQKATAQNLSVAVAANARVVVEQLATRFTKSTGIKIDLTSSSSGKITAQIIQGAPYDIFFSADTHYPETLFKKGLCLSKPILYARGKLLLCSSQPINDTNWKELLLSICKQGGHIAIANPDVAPYGKAATQSLQYYDMYQNIKSCLVFGESITQVHLFLGSGAVNAGFASASILIENRGKVKLYHFEPDPKSYQPILQALVIIKHSNAENLTKGKNLTNAQNQANAQNLTNAQKFVSFLKLPASKELFKNAGYLEP